MPGKAEEGGGLDARQPTTTQPGPEPDDAQQKQAMNNPPGVAKILVRPPERSD
jgi:hypothetical protein